jgi:hypothetical protein
MATETGCFSKWPTDAAKSSRRREARSRSTPWRTRMRWTAMSEADSGRVYTLNPVDVDPTGHGRYRTD